MIGMAQIDEQPRNRWGKKRKSGKRKPSGRLAPASVDPREVALAQPHRAKLPEELRSHPDAENPLGALRLLRQITGAELHAGKKFARTVGRYRAVLGSWDVTRQPTPGQGLDLSAEEARARKEEYDAMFEALDNQAMRAVSRVCVFQEPHADLISLRRGLKALIALWKI